LPERVGAPHPPGWHPGAGARHAVVESRLSGAQPPGMFSCQSITVSGQKASRHSSSSVLDRCEDVTRSARSDTVRAVSRYGDCCGVQKAASEPASRIESFLSRPIKATDHSAEPSGAAAAAAMPGSREPLGEDDIVCDGVVRVEVLVARASGLPQADFLGTADPYVELRLVLGDPMEPEAAKKSKKEGKRKGGKSLEEKTLVRAKTQTIRGTLSPQWDERFTFEVSNGDDAGDLFLYFRVYDYDLITSDDCLGHVSVCLLDALASGKRLTPGWEALLRQSAAPRDRLTVLQDRRLVALLPQPCKIEPIPGQEKQFDLSKAQLFLHVEITGAGSAQSSAAPVGGKRGLERPGTSPAEASDGGGLSPPTAAKRRQAEAQLVRAAAEGWVPQCFRMLSGGVSVNARASVGEFFDCAPLHIACLQGHRDLVMALVDVFNASLVQVAAGGRTAAMCACESGDEALAEWLIKEGVPADLRDDIGRTVLFYAAKHVLLQLTAWLLAKQHLIIDERALDGSTPLMLAAASPEPSAAAVVQRLLDAQASADGADKLGRSPLHLASEAGNDKCVRLLLKRGNAKANVVNGRGETPAQLGQAAGLPESTLQRLLKAGVPEARGVQQVGETADDAERRKLRARQSEVTDDEWRTWRALHPRRSPEPGTVSAQSGVRGRGEPDPEEGGSMVWRDGPGLPLFVGKGQSSTSAANVASGSAARNSTGRMGRLTAWMSGGRKPSPSPGTEDESDLEFESYSARVARA